MTSAFWNGAATYYRGIYKHLHALGYRITFAEPDIYQRQQHRDWAGDPPYAHCPIYRNRSELDVLLDRARSADLIIKHSGIGAEDEYLEAAVLEAAASAPCERRPQVAYWDVDAPATLAAIDSDPEHRFRRLLPAYDFVFTYGGGPPVVERYRRLGARCCYPIYNGFDPDTHYPAPARPQWRSDVTFLAHRLPDRELRVQHFFFGAAARCPDQQFLLAGKGWEDAALPRNVRACGFVAPRDHNALNASARLVLNLNRDSMAEVGFSPPTRIFEAAGAAAAIVCDAWNGLGLFFEPGREILVAPGPDELTDFIRTITANEAQLLGIRARTRALEQHTYRRRAERFDRILGGALATAPIAALAGEAA